MYTNIRFCNTTHILFCRFSEQVAAHTLKKCSFAPLWSSFCHGSFSNATAESWFKTVKSSVLHGESLTSDAELVKRVAQYVDCKLGSLRTVNHFLEDTDADVDDNCVNLNQVEPEENWRGKNKTNSKQKMWPFLFLKNGGWCSGYYVVQSCGLDCCLFVLTVLTHFNVKIEMTEEVSRTVSALLRQDNSGAQHGRLNIVQKLFSERVKLGSKDC